MARDDDDVDLMGDDVSDEQREDIQRTLSEERTDSANQEEAE